MAVLALPTQGRGPVASAEVRRTCEESQTPHTNQPLVHGLWIAYRRYLTPARRRSTLLPIAVLIAILAALNVTMFVFPMAHRM